MRTLFNEFEATNEDGERFSERFDDVLKPILDDMQQAGFSMRDAEALLHMAICHATAYRMLKSATTERLRRRVEHNNQVRG